MAQRVYFVRFVLPAWCIPLRTRAQAEVRREHAAGQAALQRRLFALIAEFGACTNCLGGPGGREDDTLAYVDLPIANLLFDGSQIWRLDYTDFTQGVGALCVE